ncbi:GNAT family N-acetyltransferase [Roseomonas sp. 18066]|uniref:GNAT family N-acetyltransferase n=1 Tax=Roseomonas sp. 18066 TaxID=2681412 RepID=UPI0013571DE5|nr:GNAT family N-acetyltransferase [Roseomonas sp. 18066]
MPGFTIAPAATEDDLAAIRALFAAYVETLGIDLAFQGFPEELAGLPGKYAPPAGALLLARDETGQPIGCVALRRLALPGVAEMKRLYVAPAGRGKGLGQALLDAILAEAGARGLTEIRLDTLPGMVAAQGLYLKAGFAPIDAYYPTPIEGTRFLALKL